MSNESGSVRGRFASGLFQSQPGDFTGSTRQAVVDAVCEFIRRSGSQDGLDYRETQDSIRAAFAASPNGDYMFGDAEGYSWALRFPSAAA